MRYRSLHIKCNFIFNLKASDLSCVELNLSKNRLSDVHQNLSLCKNLKILRLDENCLQKEAFSKELLEGSNISLITYAGNLFLEKEFQALPGYNSYEQRFTTTKRKIM
jgi:hypothetical protein